MYIKIERIHAETHRPRQLCSLGKQFQAAVTTQVDNAVGIPHTSTARVLRELNNPYAHCRVCFCVCVCVCVTKWGGVHQHTYLGLHCS